ncbi:MAG: hypothetical protein ACIAQF_09890 [Phycisphaerales bacterium JB065]
MKKPKNRPKTRPRSPSPSPNRVGRASRPSPTPSPSRPAPSTSEDHQLDLLLRLWEDGSHTLADIADALHLPMPALVKLLKRPDIAELLEQMTELLELRLRHIAAKAAPRALETLEQVQTEAEMESARTPISAQAIKADREARTKRNHRRLAATAILTMHRSLKALAKVAPVSDRCSANNTTAPNHKDTGQTPVPSQQAIAA